MAPDEPSGSRPAPVVLRIKLRYDDVDAMVQRFAPNVGKSGLFLPTKSLQAVGAEVKFELRLADDTPVLVGLGRVKAAKAPDPANPKAAFGMAIELMRVTRESRDVIMKMLERRKAIGLPELAIPLPADIDAARRAEVDTSTKDASATAVPTTIPTTVDSAPVLATQTINPDSGPVMTAPRRTSGPIAIAKLSAAVTALEPEAPRKKRVPVSEVIERASGPIVSAVTVPGLDDDVDVGAVIARARTLAGGNLDAELEALREMSAAPIEIGIEAASAELAKQLGGAAVTRDRSARWAPPPSTISAPVEPVEAKAEPAPRTREPTKQPIVPEPEPEVAEAKAEPVAEAKAEPAPRTREPTKQPIIPEPEPEPEPQRTLEELALRDSTPILDVDPDPEDDEAGEGEDAQEVEADQIADEIHQLMDGDVEEVEHTQIGQLPADPSVFDQHVFMTEPGVTADLERSLEQHLADAEAEADDLGLARLAPAEVLADVPGVEEEEVEEEVEEEIEDFEILAEADAEDDDLMTSHGEQEASGAHPVVAPAVVAPAVVEQLLGMQPASEQENTPLPAPMPAPHDDFDENPHIPARIRAQQRRVSGQFPIVRSSPAIIEPEPDEDDADFSVGERRPNLARALSDFAPEVTPDPRQPLPDFSLGSELTPEPRPSLSDFAARLDLSDEFEAVPEASEVAPPLSGRHANMSELEQALGDLDPRTHGELDPRSVSAGHALAAFEEPEDPSEFDDPESEGAYTLAGDMPVNSIEFDAPQATPGFSPLHQFDASDVSAPVPRVPREPVKAAKGAAAADSYDLETALEALDVDLDDLSIPQDPPPSRPPRAERVVPKRVETDIPIDFDDYEEE